MCNNIYWRFQECGHRNLQNTFPCHVARRCRPDDDMLLAAPVFLPHRPRIPTGLLDCPQRTLLKGREGWCPDCRRTRTREAARRERMMATVAARDGGGGAGARMIMPATDPLGGAVVASTSASSSIVSSPTALAVSSSETLIKSDQLRDGRQGRSFSVRRGRNKTREETPSPDADAVSDMRRSFERITMLQQCTPENPSSEMQKGQDSTKLPDRGTRQLLFQDEDTTTIQNSPYAPR